MSAITWKPADDITAEIASLRLGGEGIVFDFLPGVVRDVPQEFLAAAQTALKAIHGNLGTPAAPTIGNAGAAGAVTYTYEVVAVGQTGDSLPSASASTTTGNATLNTSNYNTVTRGSLPAHATGWRVVRTVGGTQQGDVSGVLPASQTVFNDQSMSAVAYTPAGQAPPVDLILVGSPKEV